MIDHCLNQFIQEFTESSILVKLIVLVGTYQALSVVLSLLHFVFSLIRSPLSLPKRYGQNSWALITGPTEGIGKAFCFSFAKKGMNIVLVARNKEKALKVIGEVNERYPKIQCKLVVFEFGQCLIENKVQNEIMKQIEDLDISILVNNVGISNRGSGVFYEAQSLKSMCDEITINAGAQTVLTRAFIDQLRNRKNKSAILNVSSFAGTIPTPFVEVYSGTKAFNKHLSLSLGLEYKGKIDFLALCPMVVESAMTVEFQKAGMIGIVTAESCTDQTLDKLGLENITLGHLKHRIQGSIVQLLPTGLAKNLMAKEMIRMDEKITQMNKQ